MPKTLVTGAFGQIGTELVAALQKKHGKDNVIALGRRNIPDNYDGLLEKGDVRDTEFLNTLFAKHKITQVYHLASLLSATGEKNPSLAWDVNMNGLRNILELCVKHKCSLFWPSSIAVFGPTTPRKNTPQQTILEPSTMYGVTKRAGELLCLYYFNKFGLDVRSLRYPGLISYKALPGGGTTDYAVAIFYDALQKGEYECFVKKETALPMMYMDDAITATLQLMSTPKKNITIRTSYNLAGISFTAEELAEEINKHMKVNVTYKPDFRQQIADSWPASINDSVAQKDWGWKVEYDLKKMTKIMLEKLAAKLDKSI